MKATRTLTVCLLSLGLAISAFGSGTSGKAPKQAKFAHKQAKKANKQEDKSEKAAFKQQLKNEHAACKANPHSAACHDLKQRQKMEERDFKAEEKAEKRADKK